MDHGGNAVSLFSSYFLSERYSGPNLTRRGSCAEHSEECYGKYHFCLSLSYPILSLTCLHSTIQNYPVPWYCLVVWSNSAARTRHPYANRVSHEFKHVLFCFPFFACLVLFAHLFHIFYYLPIFFIFAFVSLFLFLSSCLFFCFSLSLSSSFSSNRYSVITDEHPVHREIRQLPTAMNI